MGEGRSAPSIRSRATSADVSSARYRISTTRIGTASPGFESTSSLKSSQASYRAPLAGLRRNTPVPSATRRPTIFATCRFVAMTREVPVPSMTQPVPPHAMSLFTNSTRPTDRTVGSTPLISASVPVGKSGSGSSSTTSLRTTSGGRPTLRTIASSASRGTTLSSRPASALHARDGGRRQPGGELGLEPRAAERRRDRLPQRRRAAEPLADRLEAGLVVVPEPDHRRSLLSYRAAGRRPWIDARTASAGTNALGTWRASRARASATGSPAGAASRAAAAAVANRASIAAGVWRLRSGLHQAASSARGGLGRLGRRGERRDAVRDGHVRLARPAGRHARRAPGRTTSRPPRSVASARRRGRSARGRGPSSMTPRRRPTRRRARPRRSGPAPRRTGSPA